jgi:hypothetical protein
MIPHSKDHSGADSLPVFRSQLDLFVMLHISVNKERRGADQCTVDDELHEEVRDVGTADHSELPVL